MAYEKLRSYAVNAIGDIIPLEKEMISEMVTYTLSLPDYEVETHLLDLLGHSEASYKVVTTFLRLKKEEDDAAVQRLANEEKKKKEETAAKAAATNQALANETKGKLTKAWTSTPTASVQKSKARLLGNKASTTISELADLKPSNRITGQQAKKTKKKNLDNLKDIEAALNELEVENALEQSSLADSSTVRRVCNCMATKHPLFEVAPNCLNCGKIICSKEGLQPCSSCGNELLSEKERIEIIKILRSEKDLLQTKLSHVQDKQVQAQPSKLKPTKIKYAMTPGGNLWKDQEKALQKMEEEARKLREEKERQAEEEKEIEEQMQEFEHYERTKDINPDLLKAQERLETLLNFQATGAERTRIIDNASDFEMPSVSSGSMWLSPVERALQLKKQQKQLRKIELQEKARTGRQKKVVEMVIKDGKVKMVEKLVASDDIPEEEAEIEELNGLIKQEKLDLELALAKNTWDYTKEQDKWERPVYMGDRGSKSKLPELPTISRVQLGISDPDQLVASLPS